MQKLFLAVALSAALTGLTISASTVPAPAATAWVNGQFWTVPAAWEVDRGKIYRLNWNALSDDSAANDDSPVQSVSVSGNADPFLNYAVGFINPFAVTTSFTLNLVLPYMGGPYDRITLSHASSVTDGDSSGGATVGLNTEAHISNALLDGVVVTGLSTGCTTVTPPFSQTCFGGADSVATVLSGLAGTFGVRLDFTLSPGDAYAATGRVTLDNRSSDPVVPEPSTYVFIASGLAAVMALRRR